MISAPKVDGMAEGSENKSDLNLFYNEAKNGGEV